MRRVLSQHKYFAIAVVLISLAACARQGAASAGSDSSLTQGSKRISSEAAEPISLTPAAAASPTADIDGQVLKSYHTVLMLERADDLMIAYVQKTKTGEISLSDSAQRNPYFLAFTVALDDYNQTVPPAPSILNHAWKTVTEVTQQYLNVYNAMNQGQDISSRDLTSMRMLRQLVKNYQDYAESYLKARGKDANFFAREHQAVEAHFQKSYAGQFIPIPTLPSAPPAASPTAGAAPTPAQ